MDVASVIYNLFHSWSYIRYGIFGSLSCRGAYLNHVKIRIKGKGCKVFIGRRTRLNNCIITLRGNHCSLNIKGSTTMINNTLLDAYRTGSTISIGSSFTMEGGRIESMDGRSIIIGDNCMFSRDISICNGDNHPIFKLDQYDFPLNPSSDVTIGNHVWLCATVRVLKGVYIADDIVVGTKSLVNAPLAESHSIYVGSPAQLLKTGVTWKRS